MPIIQTPYGPKPTLNLSGGSATTLATPSSPFPVTGFQGVALHGGRTVSYAKLYRTQPWVFSSANLLVRQIARLNLKAFEFTDDEGDARRRVRTHPAAELVSRPRPGQRGLHLRHAIAQGLYVHGHYAGWKRRPRAGAPPRELWTLDWRFLTPVRDGDSGPIIAWEWSGTGIPGLDRGTRLPPADVVYVGWEAPDGGLGVSPLEPLGVTVRAEDAAQRYGEAAFRQGTRIGMAIVLDPKVKADEAIRAGVRAEVESTNGGVDNSFRNVVLGGGVTDVKPLGGQSAVEAELIAQRKVNREEVAACYAVPAPLVGILDHANYSNVQELHRMLYLTVLGPPCSLIAADLQGQIIDAEPAWANAGVFLEFDFGEVLKGATQERMLAYATALQNGVLTLNDVRRMENLEPYDDERADEPLIAANNVRPLRDVGAGPADPAGGEPAPPNAAAALAVGRHASRALERAQRGAGAGRPVLEALDVERVRRELAADLEAAGLNGASSTLAEAVAAELEHRLQDAHTLDDVRAVVTDYHGAAR